MFKSRHGIVACIALTGTSSILAGCTAPVSTSTEHGAGTPDPGTTAASGSSAHIVRHKEMATTASDDAEKEVKMALDIIDEAGAISNVAGAIQAIGAVSQLMDMIDGTDPTTAILNQLQALYNQINMVAQSLSWHMDERTREDNLSSMKSDIDVIYDKQMSHMAIDWFSIDQQTAAVVRQASGLDGLVAFERFYVDSDTDGREAFAPDGYSWTWKEPVLYTPTDLHYDNGYVYDWRLGVPAFSQLIALRLSLMALEDPNFVADGAFAAELSSIANAISLHQSLIVSGIRCNYVILNTPNDQESSIDVPRWDFGTSCADINTGINDSRGLAFADEYPLHDTCISVFDGVPTQPDPACEQQRSQDWTEWVAENIRPTMASEYQAVYQQTPMNALSSLYATVWCDAHGGNCC